MEIIHSEFYTLGVWHQGVMTPWGVAHKRCGTGRVWILGKLGNNNLIVIFKAKNLRFCMEVNYDLLLDFLPPHPLYWCCF